MADNWFEKILPRIRPSDGERQKHIPEGVWHKCPNCGSAIYQPEREAQQNVCPNCGHHERIHARARLAFFLDAGSACEWAADWRAKDALHFVDSKPYSARLAEAQAKTNENDALIVQSGQLCGLPVVVAVFDFQFMGGSMGAVVGSKFAFAAELAAEKGWPLIAFTASGGARMQEGLLSLMQMAKTAAALARLAEASVPYIVVLTDPTMGGVSASLAMLGDIQLAEPNALIGFAGPRVIEQTVREKLPKGFQRSEFLLECGQVDRIVDRRQLRREIASLLSLLLQKPLPDFECFASQVEAQAREKRLAPLE
jgi:acetyl-CoA carboxylase carboxyl transferase subunit beta